MSESDGLYEYVMTRLEACNGRLREVADGSGIALSTVRKIARREVKDPGVSYVEKLARYFRQQAAA